LLAKEQFIFDRNIQFFIEWLLLSTMIFNYNNGF